MKNRNIIFITRDTLTNVHSYIYIFLPMERKEINWSLIHLLAQVMEEVFRLIMKFYFIHIDIPKTMNRVASRDGVKVFLFFFLLLCALKVVVMKYPFRLPEAFGVSYFMVYVHIPSFHSTTILSAQSSSVSH